VEAPSFGRSSNEDRFFAYERSRHFTSILERAPNLLVGSLLRRVGYGRPTLDVIQLTRRDELDFRNRPHPRDGRATSLDRGLGRRCQLRTRGLAGRTYRTRHSGGHGCRCHRKRDGTARKRGRRSCDTSTDRPTSRGRPSRRPLPNIVSTIRNYTKSENWFFGTLRGLRV
jgi:hypothetical protein